MGKKAYHDEELLRALHWGQGWSMRKIAEKFDLDHTTIRDWMERNDIPRRGRVDATRDARRNEWATHRLQSPIYEAWTDSISRKQVFVHQLLAIADGANPYDVFADGTACHHVSAHPIDNRPENIEVMGHGEHSSYHRQQEVPESKHRVIQSATIMSEARA